MPKEEESQLFNSVTFDDDTVLEISETGETIGKEKITDKEENKGGEGDKTNTTDTKQETEEALVDDTDLQSTGGSDDASTTDNTDSSGSSSSPLSSIVAALSAEGMFDIDEKELEEVKDPAQFLRDKLNEEVNKRAKAEFSPKALEAIEAFEKGVAMSDFVNSNAREQQYTDVTDAQMEEEANQETLVRHSHIARGFSEEDALDYIKTLKDVGADKLKEKAVAARDYLIAREKQYKADLVIKAEEDKTNANKARESSLKEIKTFVDAQKEIIPGLELTDKTKTEVYKSMTTQVATENGEAINVVGQTRGKDPVAFDLKLNYYHSLGMFDKEPNFDKIKKMAESKTAKGLDKLINGGDTSFLKSGGSKSTDTENDDLGLGRF